MKALSIKQPWASLICAGAPVCKAVDNSDGSQRLELVGVTFKDVENRTWATDFRGRIYVHASKQRVKYDDALIDYLVKRGVSIYNSLMLYSPKVAPAGAIIGEVTITGCVSKSKSLWFVGPYGLVLSDPVLYDKPIPYKGQLGFFEVKL